MPTDNMSGFLDGYMAGNIAVNSYELKAHTEKIRDLLDDVKGNIVSSTIDNKSEIVSAIKKFEDKEIGIESNNEDYYNYSIDFSEVMSQIKKISNQKALPTESDYLLKRAIYHFLNIAKTLQDQRIINEATKVAMQYK
jgi:hypothetical protein